jgi:hypothetical protein
MDPEGWRRVTTPPRPREVLRWQSGPITASEGFHRPTQGSACRLPAVKQAHCDRHVLDGNMLVSFRHSPGSVATDGIADTGLDASATAASTERVPPSMVGLYSRIGQRWAARGQGAYPRGQLLPSAVGRTSTPADVTSVEQRSVSSSLCPHSFDVVQQALFDQVWMQWDGAGLVGLDGASLGRDP